MFEIRTVPDHTVIGHCRDCGYPVKKFGGFYWQYGYCWPCGDRRFDPFYREMMGLRPSPKNAFQRFAPKNDAPRRTKCE